ncbi:hypothetical protein AB6A40_009340 [Gnathostoma spinigerum]|uniref:Uncharacterized protein n=1 Tax=Gnathostoma spinigerum TaxID=75299 RepID=A0ABD6EYU5_9BILA
MFFRWSDIERVLTSKKLLGGLRITCPFSWSHLLRILCLDGPPPREFLCKILRAVPDTSQRLSLAEQYSDGKEVAVETILSQKDRLRLSNFINRFSPRSVESTRIPRTSNGAEANMHDITIIPVI